MKISPSVEPWVTEGFVRFTVSGEHTGAGLVIFITGVVEGCGSITTSEDLTEVHPTELVTVKLYVPGNKSLRVILLPDPVRLFPSG